MRFRWRSAVFKSQQSEIALPQKESGKRSLANNVTKNGRNIRKSDQKVTKRVPKTKTNVIELLLPTSFCGTLIEIATILSCDRGIYWSRRYAERIRGEFFILVRRILGKLPVNFSAKFDGEFRWRIFWPCFSRVSGHPKKFTPKIHVQNCRHSSPISLS